jgi:hypothetical protein
VGGLIPLRDRRIREQVPRDRLVGGQPIRAQAGDAA